MNNVSNVCFRCGYYGENKRIPFTYQDIEKHVCGFCVEDLQKDYFSAGLNKMMGFVDYLRERVEVEMERDNQYVDVDSEDFYDDVWKFRRELSAEEMLYTKKQQEEEERLRQQKEKEKELLMQREYEEKERQERAIKRKRVLSALEKIVGMENIKPNIENWLKRLDGQALLSEIGIQQQSIPMHIVLTGNPGVGKTMLANSLTEILYEAGFINKKEFFSYKAEDLVAHHVGGTAIKTKEAVQKAKGGVFFLDEAYRLSEGFSSNDEKGAFGKEAIETIMGHLGLKKTVFIFAGYEDKMQGFLDANPGLRSRLNTQFLLKDYTLHELMQIAMNLFKSKGYVVDDIEDALNKQIKLKMRQGILEGNGRTIATYVQKIIDQHMLRISSLDLNDETINKEALRHIKIDDVEEVFGVKSHSQNGLKETFEDAKDKINQLTGLKGVKENIEKIANFQYIQEKRKSLGLKVETKSHHMVFLGNPGTGKTTVARMVGQLFRGANVLSNGHFVEATKEMLTSGSSIPQKVKSLVDKATGGILFIDEAYTLANDRQGKEALDALIPLMENRREDFICILAGYEKDMKALFRLNEGLASRIPYHFTFEDYSVDELVDIFKKKATEEGYRLEQDALFTIAEEIKIAYTNKETSGNGRWVRNLFEECLVSQSERLYQQEKQGYELELEDFLFIRKSDIQKANKKEEIAA